MKFAKPGSIRERTVDPGLTPGVYELPSGEIFTVKPNRDRDRLYAKRLEVTVEEIEFTYAGGAVFELRPEHRMSVERARVLHEQYGRCLNCGRQIWASKSLDNGVGPVCRKAFRA